MAFRFSYLLFFFFIHSAFSYAQPGAYYLPTEARGFDANKNYRTYKRSSYDSEVESDQLTYSPIPCRIISVFSQKSDFFCSGAGSISGKRFLVDSYMVTGKALTEDTDFRFQWSKNQDFISESDALTLEFLHRINLRHSFGVHGIMDTSKSEDDIGLSYNYSHPENYMLRFQATAFDFQRNQKSESSDRFIKKPYILALSYLSLNKSYPLFIHGYIQPQFDWQQESQRTQHQASGLEVAYQKAQYFISYEYVLDNTTIDEQYEKIKLHRLHGIYQFYELETGIRLAVREFETNSDNSLFYDLLPFFWFQPPRWKHLKFGYEMTWHLSPDEADTTQHRANLIWYLINSKQTKFQALFSLDLDRITKSDRWEGGQAQLIYNF